MGSASGNRAVCWVFPRRSEGGTRHASGRPVLFEPALLTAGGDEGVSGGG